MYRECFLVLVGIVCFVTFMFHFGLRYKFQSSLQAKTIILLFKAES